MKNNTAFLIVMLGLLAGCSSQDHSDLTVFMADVKAKPAGQIEPIPTFTPYEPFDYSVTQMRSPFQRPVTIENLVQLLPASSIKPDENRVKEYLEQFPIESLNMVGTISQKGVLWALIDDNDGNVHYVKEGNYLGMDHGKIRIVGESHVQVMEIITNGVDGWVERPRNLELIEE
ncbi:MAG: pilus assembly protein PilP [Cellvibrionales bacterium]|nr:pilus assembly protein PilP [Cellvibrionales bacterium]